MEVKVDVEWVASTRPGIVDVSVTLRKLEQKGPAVLASRRSTTLETELVVQNATFFSLSKIRTKSEEAITVIGLALFQFMRVGGRKCCYNNTQPKNSDPTHRGVMNRMDFLSSGDECRWWHK
jgi:hypothetical protein